MRDLGLVKIDEPFAKLLTQGMVLNDIFSRKGETGGIEYYNPAEIDIEQDSQGRIAGGKLKVDGKAVEYGGMGTMSKSKMNGVDPQAIINEYGADTARLFMMFTSPPEQSLEWSDEGVVGAFRFLKRLWRIAFEHVEQGIVARYVSGELNAEQKALRFELHRTIQKVADDYGRRQQFNTAIAAVMELLNHLSKLTDKSPTSRAVTQEVLENTALMLSPIVPHVCEALWRTLKPISASLINMPWPSIDESALVQDEIELVVQVNGKLRGNLTVAKDATREAIEALARDHPSIEKFVAGQPIKKVIVVPGRLVNVVV